MKKAYGILRGFFALVGIATVTLVLAGVIFIGYGMGFIK